MTGEKISEFIEFKIDRGNRASNFLVPYGPRGIRSPVGAAESESRHQVFNVRICTVILLMGEWVIKTRSG